MAKLSTVFFALFFVAVILAEFAVQARHCHPPCYSDERCVSANRRERRHHHHSFNVCVPARCFRRPRRGRCLNRGIGGQVHFYRFNPATLDCQPIRSGICYNRFSSRENCELFCAPRR